MKPERSMVTRSTFLFPVPICGLTGVPNPQSFPRVIGRSGRTVQLRPETDLLTLEALTGASEADVDHSTKRSTSHLVLTAGQSAIS